MTSDHLQGWIGIASYLTIKPAAARHLHRHAGLPVWKLGKKTVASSAAAIDRWRAEREAEATRSRTDG